MPTEVAVSTQDVELVELDVCQLNSVASLLFQTYQNDALMQRIFQVEKADYAKRLRAAIREELIAQWDNDQPIIAAMHDDALLGVVCLSKVEQQFGPASRWNWYISMLLTAGWVSTRYVLEKERQIKSLLKEQPCYLLSFIGVAEQYQHQGIGRLLCQAAVQEAVERGAVKQLAVFTSDQQQQAFFNRCGFSQQHALDVHDVPGALLTLSVD
ncbi:acetyltransferase (GNAT) family protein [Idiomarina fontislapidosi]|uniref:GNAT family N-acetyltransferase n=1 Tax=Idiomarina fontislapidosi TaxID=263723 RepID=A0A432YBF4_9GAMM|nr:GNAT family N-acetyltransferase [Idiomarina fontislapidosi]PYE35446.1 acetyltransferase (GNAT) family protein [Idiomarina fontislapidosi]RUO58328.1 GNAT family N-acetyltransferase [Idiomarina fontislapidosi]